MPYTAPTWNNNAQPDIDATAMQEISDTLEAAQAQSYNATLLASGWVGTSAPYTQTLTVNGVSTGTNYIAALALNSTLAQYKAASAAGLLPTGYSTNSVTISAMLSKPSIDLPITIQR